jgi:hypothetical protein
MPRGHKRNAIRAVSERLRLFIADLMTQFARKPEELLQQAEAKLSRVRTPPEENRDSKR